MLRGGQVSEMPHEQNTIQVPSQAKASETHTSLPLLPIFFPVYVRSYLTEITIFF